MHLAVEPPACPKCTVTPAPSDPRRLHRKWQRRLCRFCSDPSCGQPDFFNRAAFCLCAVRAPPCTPCFRRPGDDIRLAHRRQNAERFLIFPSADLFAYPYGGGTHGAEATQTVVFQHTRRGVLEEIVAAKIGQLAFWALRATSWAYANGPWQQADVFLLLAIARPSSLTLTIPE